jgi:hypothetical protein
MIKGFFPNGVEQRIRDSAWWQKAAITPDNHYSNQSGIMLTDHLEAVHSNVSALFQKKESGFYGELFKMLDEFQLEKDAVADELKIVALLHDIGKPAEDKSLVIAHPLTGKPAHQRHGLVALMAAMEIFSDVPMDDHQRMRIYRTVELHDISYGLFREFSITGDEPAEEKWHYISHKIDPKTGIGLYYLLLFKLADTHGHLHLNDVTWFYETVAAQYFQPRGWNLPIPTEEDIR